MVSKILLKLLFSLFLVFLLRLVFPSIVKGIKVMVIILLIAILFFNIVLNHDLYILMQKLNFKKNKIRSKITLIC